MFEYWGSQNNDDSSSSDHHHKFYNHYYSNPLPDLTQLGYTHSNPTQTYFHNPEPQLSSMSVWPYTPMMQPDPDPAQFIIPKAEPLNEYYASRIGLNLGGRTYFSSAESEFVNRLYRQSRHDGRLVNVTRCQVEGCETDLTHAKNYHRRHKVCEFHSKAAAVVVSGLMQRFCQQCSRFHLLSEFDNEKRSCRKRLADHNRRRRKSNNQSNAITDSPSDSIPISPQDSGTQSTSSVSLAMSPPRLDYYRQGSY